MGWLPCTFRPVSRPRGSELRLAQAGFAPRSTRETAILEQTLARHRSIQRQITKVLGLSYNHLRHAMKKRGLMERPSADS